MSCPTNLAGSEAGAEGGKKKHFFCFINRRVYGGVLFNMARHGPAEALLFLAGDSKPASTSSIHLFPCYRPLKKKKCKGNINFMLGLALKKSSPSCTTM